jgi:hypothetical protein
MPEINHHKLNKATFRVSAKLPAIFNEWKNSFRRNDIMIPTLKRVGASLATLNAWGEPPDSSGGILCPAASYGLRCPASSGTHQRPTDNPLPGSTGEQWACLKDVQETFRIYDEHSLKMRSLLEN